MQRDNEKMTMLNRIDDWVKSAKIETEQMEMDFERIFYLAEKMPYEIEMITEEFLDLKSTCEEITYLVNGAKEELSTTKLDSLEGYDKPIVSSSDMSCPCDPISKNSRVSSLKVFKMNSNSKEIDDKTEHIREVLNNYSIEIKDIIVHKGPAVSFYEIIPQNRLGLSKIRYSEDEIALSLGSLGIRIIAPVPGRGTIGIEAPNRNPQMVHAHEVLESKAFQESNAKLPLCLGYTVSNEVLIADLTEMQHLLVAGATGQGKSVCLNAIITSLLYKKEPSELKLVLIDPKCVEFSPYADLENMYFAKAPDGGKAIITDTSQAIKTLNCLVQEMENRYKVLEEMRVRNIVEYNEEWRRELSELCNEQGKKKYQYMPYIVCIIDEYGDLIMNAGDEIETPFVRIAQKARAVGIHMIIATQRTSPDVITGLIRAYFPARIAFRVARSIDSRLIIDSSDAQHLIGNGDMLLSMNAELTRLQCPFVETSEIDHIRELIRLQENMYDGIKPYMLPEYVKDEE